MSLPKIAFEEAFIVPEDAAQRHVTSSTESNADAFGVLTCVRGIEAEFARRGNASVGESDELWLVRDGRAWHRPLDTAVVRVQTIPVSSGAPGGMT
jgi:hypothetical protein